MSKMIWSAHSPLGLPHLTEIPAPQGQRAVRLDEISGFAAVQVAVRRGRWTATARALQRLYGVAPPRDPSAVAAADCTMLWSGAGQLLVLAAGEGGDDLMRDLREHLSDTASLSDQTDGRSLVELSGPRVRHALAKLVSIDLDDAAFPVGAAAATAIEHVAINIWRTADQPEGQPVYDLLLPRSFADSLVRSIIAASAEYGLDVGDGRFRPEPVEG